VKFNELDWEEPLEGIICKIYKHSDRQIRLVSYSRNMPPHWCEKGHYGYILDGIFEIEFQDKTVIFHRGDGIFIPDGKKHRHRARVLSDVVKVIFVENV
jgi:hypothetical protein